MEDAQTVEAPAEYPKMLYKGGQPYTETGHGVPHQDTLVVNSAEEEEEAKAEGFAPAEPNEPHAEEPEAPAGDETVAAPAGDETLSGGAGNDALPQA